jgi:peptidoglycan-associated lipoprotein
MAPVYFNYDRAEITPETRQALDAKLPLLTANADLRLRLSGHADERGSDEYNIALGQRRAAAVWHYLIGHGIAEARLEIVSFGEERPICQVAAESCWWQNRRVEFDITAGADRITER